MSSNTEEKGGTRFSSFPLRNGCSPFTKHGATGPERALFVCFKAFGVIKVFTGALVESARIAAVA